MVDSKGKLIGLGDRVAIHGSGDGVVVFSIDTDEFSAEFPKSNWAYLGRGIMLKGPIFGLLYLKEEGEEYITIIDPGISN